VTSRADVDGAIALIGHALEGIIEDLRASGVDEIPRSSVAVTEEPVPKGQSEQPSRAETVAPIKGPPSKAADVSTKLPSAGASSTGVTATGVDDPPRDAAGAGSRTPERRTREAEVRAGAARVPESTTTPAQHPSTVAGESSDQLSALVGNTGLPASERLRVLQDDIIGACTRCKLHRGRTKLVFGAGSPRAELVFVGEGPGAEEDRQGVPFVGRAGELLTKMIEAMQFSRDDVYILNVVKCRPPNNRDPEPDEIAACEPFLKAQLAIIRPRVIVSLGRYATHALLGTRAPISTLRGKWFHYEGVDLMPTFHPSFLLRSPDKKREAWADLQQVMRHFGTQRTS
jgi:uracil-DNA glycosylase family 4